MNQDAFRALLDLLPQVFPTPDALRVWLVKAVPDGDRIVNNLPNTHVAPAQYFFAAADILRRWGLLGVPEFWDPFEDETPFALQQNVAELRVKFGVTPRTTPGKAKSDPTNPKVSVPSIAATPSKIDVLLVSASPESDVRLRVDIEFRNIIAKMRSTELRDRFNFIQLQAARFDDLRTALLLHKPHVLHISSHGLPDGTLKFEASDDGTGHLAKPKFIKLLKALRDNLRLVVVNACYSDEIVQDIPPTIDLAIGMSHRIKDADAMKFAVAFYESLGFGRHVENAFDIASADLDDDLVKLFPTADPKRQIPLVAR